MSDTQEYTVTLPIPAGAVVQSSILVVGYFNTEGATCYGFATRGEGSLSNAIGLLELAKAHLMKDEGPGS